MKKGVNLVFVLILLVFSVGFVYARPLCMDTDGGINYPVYGTCSSFVNGSLQYFNDACTTNTMLKEYYCPSGMLPCNFTTYTCPNGCSNGTCNTCKPSCIGKTCGSDGCGGTCGTCGTNTLCMAGVCNYYCNDSDGGFNPSVKGSINNNPTWTDACKWKNNSVYSNTASCSGADCYLGEFYCTVNFSSTPIVMTAQYYNCPNGCSNGACNPAKITCSNSADCSYMAYSQNYCRNSSLKCAYTATPVCSFPGTAQSYCWGNGSEVCTPCTNGCLNGVCNGDLPGNNTQNSCIDSDDGISYYIFGGVNFTDTNGKNGYSVDSCIGNTILQEQSCSPNPSLTGNVTMTTQFNCPDGCLNGACISNSCTPYDIIVNVGQTTNFVLNRSNYQITLNGIDSSYHASLTINSDSKTILQGETKVIGGVSVYAGTIFVTGTNTGYVILTLSCSNLTQNYVCIDSDGGLNYNVKGTVNLNSGGNFTDFCVNSAQVTEGYCDSTSSTGVRTTTASCPNGCNNGACSVVLASGGIWRSIVDFFKNLF